jgi:hypothetical protein
MATLSFRCPATGLKVRARFAEAQSSEGETHETVKCLACNQTHLINRSSGKTLGNDEEWASVGGLVARRSPASAGLLFMSRLSGVDQDQSRAVNHPVFRLGSYRIDPTCLKSSEAGLLLEM